MHCWNCSTEAGSRPTLGHCDARVVSSPVVIRPRRPEDIPALIDALFEQQPSSRYPFRNPLPIPAEQFVHADDAVAAWTAELHGEPIGHVCWVGPRSGFPGAEEMSRACAEAHGCSLEQLAWVSTLFVGLGGRGLGAGRLLLDAVVADIRNAGSAPCLEVVTTHATALAMYQDAGWREVMRLRPQWLKDATGDQGPEALVMVLDSAS